MSAQIAILCSDIHLSLKQPACRDDDWMQVQVRYLKQLKALAEGLPILCAGDIFDRWNPPPELIRFALEYLPPNMICVPGQHDLPNHRMDEMKRSAYGCLVQAGKITCVASHRREEVPSRSHLDLLGNWRVYGFGWNEEITPPIMTMPPARAVALVHRYVWTSGHAYPGAAESAHLGAIVKQLRGYNVAVFGDNHSGFLERVKGLRVLNCGGFIRRKSDEINYQPCVGILYEDGGVVLHNLDVSKDKFKNSHELAKAMEVDVSAFVEQLETMKEHGLDFRASVRRGLDQMDIPGPVRELVLRCIE